MVLLATRVSAWLPPPIMTSTWATPSDFAAAVTRPNISSHRARFSSSDSLIRPADLDSRESRRARSVTCPHHLLGLPLAAVRRAPQRPMLRPRDRRARVPELRADPAVARILQHAPALAVPNLPGDLAPELEVVALVVDRPALVGLHVNAAIGSAENCLQRLPARLEADVSHADQRDPPPAVRPHRPVRAILPHRRSGLPRRHVPDEQAVANDVRPLRRHSLIVERECPQPRPVLQTSIANHVHHVGPVTQPAQLIERQKTHARVIRLAAQDAIEL